MPTAAQDSKVALARKVVMELMMAALVAPAVTGAPEGTGAVAPVALAVARIRSTSCKALRLR